MKRYFLIGLLIAAILAAACAMYKATLKTQTAGTIDPAGTYTLIKYGGNYADDYTTFALIVPDSGKYIFDIFKPAFEYRVVKGLSSIRVLEMAQEFVKGNPDFKMAQLNGIIGPAGDVIGYEVRPIYRSTLFGKEDILLIEYFLKEGNVVEVRIDVDDVVKNRNKGGTGGSDGGN